jgi:hypothetical protein
MCGILPPRLLTILHESKIATQVIQFTCNFVVSGRYWEALTYYQKALTFSVLHRPSLLGAARILRAKGQWPRVHQLMIRYCNLNTKLEVKMLEACV